jgi:hypothetical protein
LCIPVARSAWQELAAATAEADPDFAVMPGLPAAHLASQKLAATATIAAAAAAAAAQIDLGCAVGAAAAPAAAEAARQATAANQANQ